MKDDFDLGNLELFQLGYVYKDVEKQSRIMESVYGMSKFIVFDPVDIQINYRGKDTEIKVKAAFGKLKDTEFELIQLVEGDSIYKEFLDQGRQGLHHVCYRVENLQNLVKKYISEGVNVLQSGKIITTSYAYMDTEKTLGIIIELAEEKKRGKRKKEITYSNKKEVDLRRNN